MMLGKQTSAKEREIENLSNEDVKNIVKRMVK